MHNLPGKPYFDFIARLQQTALVIAYALLILLPPLFAYAPDAAAPWQAFLFELSLFTAFLVLSIRPLADLLPRNPWIRPLVILRKGFGSFSASIIVAFMLAKLLENGIGYLGHYASAGAWSLGGYAFLSPLGDLSALVLLVTSNQYSKRVLGRNWKRVQKLAYVYFAAGALYEYLVIGKFSALSYLVFAAAFGAAAFIAKRAAPAPAPVAV